MGLTSDIQNITGVVTVQIEGFFTERFLNLCRINNVKIWDIRNIVKGVVRFKIHVKEFKKLRPIAKKTKCKVYIKEKKGLYFTLFKYRKRKLAIMLVILFIIFSIAFSTFIWDIDVSGNNNFSEQEIKAKLKDSGMYVGKCKIGLDKKEIINELRVQMPDLSWVGIEIDGTTAYLKVVEKTKLADGAQQESVPGDIVATKSGVITKIVAENGTAMYKEGSYVEKGQVLIEGMIYSKTLEPSSVPAKGIVNIDSIYKYTNEYKFDDIKKNYTGKIRSTIGITINSKENMLNYLNKSKKYDINKSSKTFHIFGNEISLDWYKCKEYDEEQIIREKEELLNIARQDAQNYLDNEILKNVNNGSVVDTTESMQDTQDGVIVTIEYVVNERIGEFVERNN